MLLSVYMFSLALGGVLLGASLLLGGKDGFDGADGPDVDAGADFHAELDADMDLDADLDADLDVDADAHVEAGTDASKDLELGGGADFLMWSLTSVRFWTFFLAFFGLTGLIFDGFSLVSHEAITAALAVTMGASAGFGISKAVRVLSTDDTGRVADSRDFVGKSARVLIPPAIGGVGKVRVEIAGNLVDVLATTDEGNVLSQDEVMIIEMDGTTARVAKVMSADS
jgi:membrane protein implicated in regulation of membrane protease activity